MTVILGAIIFCCFISLLGVVAQHFVGTEKPDRNSLLYLFFVTMSLQGAIVLSTALFLKARRVKWSEAFGFSSANTGRAVLVGFVAAIIFLPIGGLLQSASMDLISRLHFKPPAQEAVVTLQDATALSTRAYLIAFYVSIGPLAEEILFRGILYPAIKQAGYRRVALWSTSIAFAAIHFNLPVFLPLLVLGMISVFLYEKTNNLLASVTLHSTFNGIELILMYFGEYLTRLFTHWWQHHGP
jgi:membrane protease YdiL (CAAX protease family)